MHCNKRRYINTVLMLHFKDLENLVELTSLDQIKEYLSMLRLPTPMNLSVRGPQTWRRLQWFQNVQKLGLCSVDPTARYFDHACLYFSQSNPQSNVECHLDRSQDSCDKFFDVCFTAKNKKYETAYLYGAPCRTPRFLRFLKLIPKFFTDFFFTPFFSCKFFPKKILRTVLFRWDFSSARFFFLNFLWSWNEKFPLALFSTASLLSTFVSSLR